jgi:hypothetical protein
VTGKIVEILQDSTNNLMIVVLDIFSIAAHRHEIFGMPILLRPFEEEKYLVLKSDVSYDS